MSPRAAAAERRDWLVALILAAGAAAASVVATRRGPLLAPDSVTYLSMARNLTHGRGFVDFTGVDVTVFAPGFPALLARGQALGLTAITTARTVNAVASASVVMLAFVLLRRHVRSRFILLGATALIAGSVQLLNTTEYVSTDVVFYALVLVFILAMEEIAALSRPRPVLIVAASVVVWAAFLVRYAGLSLLAAGAITLLVISRRDGVRKALMRAGSFGLLALVVPGLWFVRNTRIASGGASGLRVQSHESLDSIVVDVGRGAAHLVIPDSLGTGPGVLLMGALVGGAALMGLIGRRALGPRLRADGSSVVPIVIFVVVYVVFVAAARKSTGSDIDPRILLPAWLPALVLGAWYFDKVLCSLRAVGSAGLARVVAMAAVALLIVSAYWLVDQVRLGTQPSVADHHYPVHDVATRADVGHLDPGALLVSNDPWRVYNATGHQPVKLAPMPLAPGFSHRPISVNELLRAVSRHPVTLIWFDRSPANDGRRISSLPGQDRYRLTGVRSFPGGARYTVRPGRSSHAR